MAHYADEGTEQVATALALPFAQVQNKACRLHLRVNPETYYRIVHARAQAYMTASNPMKRPEVQAKVSKWNRETPEGRAHFARLQVGHQTLERERPSKVEQRLREMLNVLGISYEPSALIKPNFVVDIRIGALIIEADGDYWHGHPRFEPLTERQLAQQRRDQSRNTYLRACGYTVLRIWEYDLKQQPDAVQQAILAALVETTGQHHAASASSSVTSL